MDVMPELRKCKTKNEAMKRLKNERDKFARAELLRRVDLRIKENPEEDTIKLICGDAVKVLREMETASVDMCIADPPFGVTLGSQVDASPVAGLYDTYQDEKGEVYETIRLVIKEVSRVLRPNSHFYLFFPLGRTYSWFIKQLDESFEFVDPLPLIWYKTNKGGAGYTGDTKKRYMLHYQPILFSSKGNRALTQAKSNVIPLDIILKGRENPAEMPSELMEYFIEQSSLPGETVLEVYAGTGPVVRAAKRLKRRGIGIESRQEQIDVIRVRLMEG
jgi:site-specific DNA-methyltransferase (adenine-specific)